jgi:hypothetical protein
VTYADPGYQADGKARYPLDTEAHCRAAWSYINMPKNAAKYSSEQLARIKAKIKAAGKKYGIDFGGGRSMPADSFYVRSFDFETRGVDDGRTLEGYAAVFGKPARIRDLKGDFDEVIAPGAFTRSLAERTPVMQFEHGKDPRVGHVPIAAIQELREDQQGLYVRARLFDNDVVEPVRQAIEGEAIRGMSFRFSVPEGGDKWTRDGGQREIRDADVYELGPVVHPAYDTTSVGVRSLLAQLDPDEHRILLRELAAELRLAAYEESLETYEAGWDEGRHLIADFTGRPGARSSGGGEPVAEPGNGAGPKVPYDTLIWLREKNNARH